MKRMVKKSRCCDNKSITIIYSEGHYIGDAGGQSVKNLKLERLNHCHSRFFLIKKALFRYKNPRTRAINPETVTSCNFKGL